MGRTRRQLREREREQELGRNSRRQVRERESERVMDGRRRQHKERERWRGEIEKVTS